MPALSRIQGTYSMQGPFSICSTGFFYYNRQIYAFDKDPKRVEILKQRVHQSGACNVQVQHTDFLKVTKVSP